MGGVIAYGDDDWFVANYEFRRLLGAASAKIEPDEDRQLLVQAQALHGLRLDELGDEQRRRVVAAIDDAATELAEADTSPRDDREAEFRSRLAELRTMLARPAA